MYVAKKASINLRERANASVGQRVYGIPNELVDYARMQGYDALDFCPRVGCVRLVQAKAIVVSSLQYSFDVFGLSIWEQQRWIIRSVRRNNVYRITLLVSPGCMAT